MRAKETPRFKKVFYKKKKSFLHTPPLQKALETDSASSYNYAYKVKTSLVLIRSSENLQHLGILKCFKCNNKLSFVCLTDY